MRIVVGVPCHRDEPGVDTTVDGLLVAARPLAAAGHEVRVVVAVNGDAPGDSPAWRALDRLVTGPAPATEPAAVGVERLAIATASKPAAWNALRDLGADTSVFADADVAVAPGALVALVEALDADAELVVAAADQRPADAPGVVARVATVPHRLRFGGVAGTLYAARTAALPSGMPPVVLDDAWLFAAVDGRVRRVHEAVAVFHPPARWRDLWRQRVRAEAGKLELAALGLPVAPPPPELRGGGRRVARLARAYPPGEWPFVVALAGVRALAGLRARWLRRRGGTGRAQPGWAVAGSTKAPTPKAPTPKLRE